MNVLKFSSEDCGTCHRMSHYDSKVCEELNCPMINVLIQDTEAYRRYRHILLMQHPNKEGMGWPTYLVVSSPEAEFKIHGEIQGGMTKGEFRSRLSEIMEIEAAK